MRENWKKASPELTSLIPNKPLTGPIGAKTQFISSLIASHEGIQSLGTLSSRHSERKQSSTGSQRVTEIGTAVSLDKHSRL